MWQELAKSASSSTERDLKAASETCRRVVSSVMPRRAGVGEQYSYNRVFPSVALLQTVSKGKVQVPH